MFCLFNIPGDFGGTQMEGIASHQWEKKVKLSKILKTENILITY